MFFSAQRTEGGERLRRGDGGGELPLGAATAGARRIPGDGGGELGVDQPCWRGGA